MHTQPQLNIPLAHLEAIRDTLLQIVHVDLPDWLDTNPGEEAVRDTLVAAFDCMAILDAAHDKIR